LIDEIDKAPPDFANDLLDEIDRGRMRVPEISAEHVVLAKQKPVVIITSNRERELSRAFLRRCIFHYIDYPDAKQLEQIVLSRLDGQVTAGFVKLAVQRFEVLRSLAQLVKPPATGELVLWTSVLVGLGVTSEQLRGVSVLGELPAIQALIKRKDDLDACRKVAAPVDANDAVD
jgi:MoxR-like ATPase